MNKKFLGIKVSTYLTVLLSIVSAFAFWLIVKSSSADAAFAFISSKFI